MEYVKEERTVSLTDGQAKRMLAEFYRGVAQAAGYEETEDTVYDCTHILVAPNVQDAIIEAYQEAYPDAEEVEIIMKLAYSGPKVCRELGRNEARIQPGFIRKRENG